MGDTLRGVRTAFGPHPNRRTAERACHFPLSPPSRSPGETMAIELSPVPDRPTSRRLTRRLAARLARAVALVAAALLALTGIANADPDGTLHEDADRAGSTIRAHEA